MSAASNDNFSEKASLSWADAFSDCSPEGLPERIPSLIAIP
jgi:hypothetical protein